LSNQIAYIEASSHKAIVTFNNGVSKTVNNGLKDFEALPCNSGSSFMRIHHSFIINFQYVTLYLTEEVAHSDDEKKNIPIQKKEEFFRRINMTGKI
jgi:DNA-binding LytR/AlgR family response regulator